MLKYIYRVIILIAVFIGALYYFSGDIKVVVFDVDNTTEMEAATFPLVTMKSDESNINLLHGYSTNLAANKLRETVIPLNMDKTFEVVIKEEDYDIKKLNYEVREFVGNALIETDSVSVFEEEGNKKTAKVKLKAELATEKEYAVKITLITSESEKMYYYQRIKIYENAYLKEKLDFILNFHESIMSKAKAQNIIDYLEPLDTADNTSLAYVNINSGFEQVTWGNLKPVILTEIIPNIREIYMDTATVELEYYIEAEVAGVTEQYHVTEFYRVRYSQDRMYLLNYERRMESLFDIKLASLSKSELKVGITSDPEMSSLISTDQRKLAFVRNNELWFYDLENNIVTNVFSFRQDNKDYLRELYDQHNIRILNMDAEGNLDFMVYGYMNRGQYEGRVAIILYRFIRAESRIEEMVYIPVEEPYQTLKENLGELTYVNAMEVFYFHIYNNIYAYNLITREISEIATNITSDQVVILGKLNYAAWQENSDPKLNKNIKIMNLETGVVESIEAKEGYTIRLMDEIDSNLIYGYVFKEDISQVMDGSIMAPLSSVEIASVDKKVLKSYSKSGYYISGLQVKDNIVELRRVQKIKEDGRMAYIFTDQDYIMNQVKTEEKFTGVTSRVTDQALTEFYMSLPSGFVMNTLPEVKNTVNTIISVDPTVRLSIDEQKQLYYYPYISGGIEGAYANASDAIAVARDNIGVVWSNNRQLIWERGVKSTKNTIIEFENMTWSASSENTIETCIKLLLNYQKVNVSAKKLSVDKSSAFDVIAKYSKYTPIRLTGITLDDALYYVSKGRPVIAMTDVSNAVIIYGYDAFNIMVIDPLTNRTKKIGIGDSANMFAAAGNVFLSYLEQ
ncbi:MAG: putative rane protein [Herbinix sp.]|nr:putative rane protein [Herbinix sp.]